MHVTRKLTLHFNGDQTTLMQLTRAYLHCSSNSDILRTVSRSVSKGHSMAFRDQLTVPVGSEITPGMSRSLSLSILTPNGFNKRPFVGKIKGMYVPGNIGELCDIGRRVGGSGKEGRMASRKRECGDLPALYGAVK